MSIQLHVETPTHEKVVKSIQAQSPTQAQLLSIVFEIAGVAEQQILNYMQSHFRTGATMSSIRRRIVYANALGVAVAVGSQTRGQVLRWLDLGRGEVRPLRRRFLRYLLHPSGVVMFSKYSRATQASNIMRIAALEAVAASDSIVKRSMSNPAYAV